MSGHEIPKYRLERRRVMKNEQNKTSSGLNKEHLMYTSGRNGKVRTIVSVARHKQAKKNQKLQEWLKHVKEVYDRIKPAGRTYKEAMKLASDSWHSTSWQ